MITWSTVDRPTTLFVTDDDSSPLQNAVRALKGLLVTCLAGMSLLQNTICVSNFY